MNYIANRTEHVVVKGDKWQLIDLSYGANLSTSKPFDVYTDRQEAIDAIKAHDPAFEPSEWEPPAVPQTVTMRQGRLALHAAGLLEHVDAAIEAIPGPAQRKAAEIEWEFAQQFDRKWPLVAALAHQLSLSEEQLDEMFRQAATL